MGSLVIEISEPAQGRNEATRALIFGAVTIVSEGMTDAPDEQLMLRYAQGDLTAFETLYARYKGPLFRYVRRQVGDQATAEELYQDIWANLIRARTRYEVRAKFSTWLYRMARNRVVDWYRSVNRHQEISLSAQMHPDCEDRGEPMELPDHDAPAAGRALDAERAVIQVKAAIAALPADQRDAFLLQEESGLSLDEIALVTGVGRETVKSRLRYALTKLRAAVQWSAREAP